MFGWCGQRNPSHTRPTGKDRAFRQFRVGHLTAYSVWAVSSTRPATEEAGRDFAPAGAGAEPFGANSAEVSAFIGALRRLTGAQWRKVVAARRSAGTLIRDPTVLSAEEVRGMLQGDAS